MHYTISRLRPSSSPTHNPCLFISVLPVLVLPLLLSRLHLVVTGIVIARDDGSVGCRLWEWQGASVVGSIRIYTCTYASLIYDYMYPCQSEFILVSICVCTCTYASLYKFMYPRTYVRIYACMYICMHVWSYMYVHLHTCRCKHTCMCVCM